MKLLHKAAAAALRLLFNSRRVAATLACREGGAICWSRECHRSASRWRLRAVEHGGRYHQRVCCFYLSAVLEAAEGSLLLMEARRGRKLGCCRAAA